MTRIPLRQTLLIDADDTLWENNIYFERAIAAFISSLSHHSYAPQEIRELLYQIERETIARHGYGLASFRRSLVACFERLSAEPITAEKHAEILSFAQTIANHEIEMLAGVTETLPALAHRHQLILMTKGDPEEQSEKLHRSGVREHFTAVEIPHEKDPAAYQRVLAKFALDPRTTWMIGNSPRSDINPALAAGLHAVLIQHPNTWALEHDEITPPAPPQRLLTLSAFHDLANHF